MNYVVSHEKKPPVGGFGGSIWDWERGNDPFARESMPEEFQNLFKDEPAKKGWLALDWCGNVIGFCPDGHKWKKKIESWQIKHWTEN